MDSPFLGMVQYFAFDWAPKGYALANGALLNINSNAALFALFGTFYGGNGTTTFGVPDLRGRSIIGQGQQWTIGEKLGTENATLLTANMPVHTHTATVKIAANNTNATSGTAGPTEYSAKSIALGKNLYSTTPDPNTFFGALSVVVQPAGLNTPFSTLNPYVALTCCVTTTGIFPSRN